MKLINADDIHYCMYDLDNYHTFWAVTDDEIAEMPTIDAAPVVHAKWIMLDPDRNGNSRPVCSACNTYKLMAWSDHARCNFCPECGAKMDGE